MGCTNNPRNPSPYDRNALDLMFRHGVFGEFDEEIPSLLKCYCVDTLLINPELQCRIK